MSQTTVILSLSFLLFVIFNFQNEQKQLVWKIGMPCMQVRRRKKAIPIARWESSSTLCVVPLGMQFPKCKLLRLSSSLEYTIEQKINKYFDK